MSAGPKDDRTAFVFPGVGVLLRWQEAEFFERHRALMASFLEEASEWAGADLIGGLARGTVAGLDERARELFTHAFNCAAAAVFLKAGLRPAFMAGHSLGVYSALVASGALSFSEGLMTVDRARALVRESCPDGAFGMGVVIGLTDWEINALLDRNGFLSLSVASTNSAASKVISGHRAELESFLAETQASGALKAVLLDLDMPYHHPRYLAGTRAPFEAFLRELSWEWPSCPVISSLDQKLLADPEELIEFTARNLSTHINWHRTVETIARLGVETVVECGPGISLTQNAHFIEGAPHHVNVRTARWRLGI